MRYGIFSDIHSNKEALHSVLDACQKERIDTYLCVGDIVGYAASPHECLAEIRQRNIITVAGNHDWASTGKFDINYFNPPARQALSWTHQMLTPDEVSYLNSLNLVYREENFCLVHATLSQPGKFYYLYDIADAKELFELLDTQLCFVGHTHRPVAFMQDNNMISSSRDDTIRIQKDKQYIVNVGSVGQPRDGDGRACYCVYDSEQKVVSIKRVEYDFSTAQKNIIDAGLPRLFAQRLSMGR